MRCACLSPLRKACVVPACTSTQLSHTLGACAPVIGPLYFACSRSSFPASAHQSPEQLTTQLLQRSHAGAAASALAPNPAVSTSPRCLTDGYPLFVTEHGPIAQRHCCLATIVPCPPMKSSMKRSWDVFLISCPSDFPNYRRNEQHILFAALSQGHHHKATG